MAARKKTAKTSAPTPTFDINSLVGLTEEIAKAKITGAGLKVRVRSRDGESFMGTADYRLDRINIHLQDGKVTKASIG